VSHSLHRLCCVVQGWGKSPDRDLLREMRSRRRLAEGAMVKSIQFYELWKCSNVFAFSRFDHATCLPLDWVSRLQEVVSKLKGICRHSRGVLHEKKTRSLEPKRSCGRRQNYCMHMHIDIPSAGWYGKIIKVIETAGLSRGR
jgi:hypothetical protein